MRAALVLLALFVSACAQVRAPAGSAFAGMRWGSDPDRGQPNLFYGVPDSDVFWLAMNCKPGSGRVSLMMTGVNGRQFRLSSGRRSVRALATGLDEIDAATAEISAADPVLRAFAASGQLAYGSERGVAPLPAADPRIAQRFVDRCSAGTGGERTR